jgi:hypothetical protein
MKRILLATVTTLACGHAGAAPIAASHGDATTPEAHTLATESLARGVVLYSQDGTDSGISIVSQNFEATFDAYDSEAADDFTVPARSKITEVDVVGTYFNGSGPASSMNVTFYKSKNGKPGAVLGDFQGLAYQMDGRTTRIPLPSKIPMCCRQDAVYYVGAQANKECCRRGGAVTSGDWGWGTQTTVVGAPAVWRNPGDGYATGCTTFTTETTCFPYGQGDHLFTIRGKLKGAGR